MSYRTISTKRTNTACRLAHGVNRSSKRAHSAYRFVKRTFDVAFSAGAVAVTFAPCIFLALAIARDTGGSPLYSQTRIGRYGVPFKLYKFRTMVADADDLEKHLTQEQIAEWHSEHKIDDDPRITRLGALLRRTSMDEIPQFINVLAGQMSIVGPRAISQEELAWYTPREQEELLSVPQGITGLWQVTDRNEATFRTGQRQQIELEYARNAGFRMDIFVLGRTLGAMFGKNKTGR